MEARILPLLENGKQSVLKGKSLFYFTGDKGAYILK
ncbi:MAG: Uncharacterised protein [Polaribacter sp. SA4-10]|nr:MAG: Uncharacterised protein [Polaribacter sp. SA4-10]